MADFRVGDIVISTKNAWCTYVVTQVFEKHMRIEVLYNSLGSSSGNKFTIEAPDIIEIIRHKNPFLSMVKHALEDADEKSVAGK